jgi:hypothetical protein
MLNSSFFAAGVALLVMGLLYNTPPVRLKDLPYVDVLSESINNPIRLMLGWFVISAGEVPPLSLLIAYWMLGAFFMAAKRFAEYRTIGNPTIAKSYRASFRHYNEQKLLVSMFYYSTCFGLFLGVFVVRYHLELILVLPFVAGFQCLYVLIAFREKSAAQRPEHLYREKGLIAYLLISMVLFVCLMFVKIPACYDWFNVRPSPVPALWHIAPASQLPVSSDCEMPICLPDERAQ